MNGLTKAIALFVAVTALIYFVRYLIYAGDYEDTNDAQVEEYINPVNTRIPGYLKEVRFNDHQRFRKGDTRCFFAPHTEIGAAY